MDDRDTKSMRVLPSESTTQAAGNSMGVETNNATGDEYVAMGPGPQVQQVVYGSSAWLWHFCLMGICFGINHGCVTAVLALASADFNHDVASISSATLYFFYTLSALLFAVPVVLIKGPKFVLCLGTALYCLYVIPFAIITVGGKYISEEAGLVLATVGSVIGGMGAGWLWTAQGAYFAKAAELYSQETGKPIEDVNGFFGGVFAFLYVGWEVILKLFSSVVRDSWTAHHDKTSTDFVFLFYAGACCLSAFAMNFIKAVPLEKPDAEIMEQGGKPGCLTLMCKKLKSIQEVGTDIKIWLLGPLNVSFGYCASYLAFYMSGTVAKASIGASNIGYLTAIIPGYAAVASPPYAWVSQYTGKGFMMWFGCASFFTIGLIGWLVPQKILIDGGWPTLIGIYLLQGNGRAVFESTNRAVFADFFPDTKAGAFAFLGVQGGLSGMIGFLVFVPQFHTKASVAAEALVWIGAFSMIAVPAAFVVNHFETKARAQREALLQDYASVA